MRAGVYTGAGLVSSVLVGAILGAAGAVVAPSEPSSVPFFSGLVAAIALGLREAGIVRFPLPQIPRQTSQRWGHTLRPLFAAGLWGLDIGLAFSTFRTFSGAWILLVLAIALRSPAFAAVLFGAFWIGRTLSVWLAPHITGWDATATPLFTDAILASRAGFRKVHVSALLIIAVLLTAMVVG